MEEETFKITEEKIQSSNNKNVNEKKTSNFAKIMKYVVYIFFIIVAVFLGIYIFSKINEKIEKKSDEIKTPKIDSNLVDNNKKQNELKILKEENKYY